MKTENKKHTRVSLNLYLVAGIYLLYTDYSMLSEWSTIEPSKRIIVIIAAIVFAIFGIAIMVYSIKAQIAMQPKKEKKMKEIKEKRNDNIE
ncbi:MAG TPA: hypothetical protein GX707_05170 [Epulopiscium sp.]|nr:hypothetical protein [Candidatus Epulonipiscium sp.]